MPDDHHFTDLLLAQKRLRADPPADAVIEQVVATHGPAEAKKVFDLLIRNIELPLGQLPPQIRTFVQTHSRLPSWADAGQIGLAQDFFIDHGPKLLIILYFKSLPILYSCKNGAQVLVQTGRLAYNQQEPLIFSRRIAETGQFLLEVMAPQGLRENGGALHTILKVRLIHAAIRSFIPADRWDENTLGKPINQEDMALTLMTFSVALLDGLKQFGIYENTEKQEAYLHSWKVIGHLLGIDADLLPENVPEGKMLLSRIIERESASSEEGKILADALISFVEGHFKTAMGKVSPRILIRYLAGTAIAGRIGVNRSPWWWLYWILPAFLKKSFQVGEKLEDRVGPLQPFINKFSGRMVRAMVGYFNAYKGVPFQVPVLLRQKWGL